MIRPPLLGYGIKQNKILTDLPGCSLLIEYTMLLYTYKQWKGLHYD